MPGNKKKFQPPKKSKKDRKVTVPVGPKVTQYAKLQFTEMTNLIEAHNRQWFTANMMKDTNEFLTLVCIEYKMNPALQYKNPAELATAMLLAVKDRHGLT